MGGARVAVWEEAGEVPSLPLPNGPHWFISHLAQLATMSNVDWSIEPSKSCKSLEYILLFLSQQYIIQECKAMGE